MNALHAAIQGAQGWTVAERIGWTLLQSLWEGAAIALLLAVVLWILRRQSARARYGAACAAMVLIALLPVATALWVSGVPRAESAAAIGNSGPPEANVVAHFVPVRPESSDPARPALLPVILRAVSLAWLIGVMLLSFWNLRGWRAVQRLRRRAVPAPAAWQKKMGQQAMMLRVRRPVGLRLCDGVWAPAMIGWLRPIILLPASVLSELPAAHIEALLLHELAHVRRHDYLVNLLQIIVETLLFYHPAAWWIGHVIRRERENCCDDIAAANCESAVSYARALACMEEMRWGRAFSPALGSTGGGLRRRIERLVAPGWQRPNRPVPPFAMAAALIIVAGLLLPAARMLANPPSRGETPPKSSPDTRAAKQNGIRPEDLQPGQPTDYRISPNDLLAITIGDLEGPNSETVRQTRVTATGNISMPYIQRPIRAAGLTEIGLERAIIKDYHDAAVITHARVSVNIVEARGRMFSIVGAVKNAGEYQINQIAFRLLDAIAAAGGVTANAQMIHVLRKADRNQPARTIEIPAEKLLGGDGNFNVVLHPGDTIVVSPGPLTPGMNPVAQTQAAHGLVYIGGHVVKPGAYAMPDKPFTVRSLILAAGGIGGDVPSRGPYVQIIHRAGNGKSQLKSLPEDALMNPAPDRADIDFQLHAGDQVLVGAHGR